MHSKRYSPYYPTPRCYAPISKAAKQTAPFLLLSVLAMTASPAPSYAQVLVSDLSSAAVSLSGLTNFTYTQDFNSLPKNGSATISTLNTPALAGLQIAQTKSPATSNIIADDGSGPAGATSGIHSYVVSGGSNTRFGTLTNTGNTGDIYYGFRFLNNTNASILSMSVQYTGEIWRSGQNNFTETLSFSSAVFDANAGGLGNSGYSTAEDNLQFTETSPDGIGSQAFALQSKIKSGTITFSTPVESGKEIWIRWADGENASVNDNGMGINDLSVVFTPTPAPPAAVSALIGSAILGLPSVSARWRARRRLC